MTHFSVLLASVALAIGINGQAGKPQDKSAAAAIQGTWVVSTINGQAGMAGSPEMTLTFTGDKYEQSVGGQVNERGGIKVDTSKKPMTIDLAIAEGPDAGKAQLGIFEVSGDTMKLHLDAPGAGQRPTDFTVKEGSFMVIAKKKP
jgi:uncharacterized protein (TIGR03067 family)